MGTSTRSGVTTVAVVAAASLSMTLGAALLVTACVGPEASTQAAGDAGADVEVDSPFQIVNAPPAGEALTAIWGQDSENVFAVGTNGVVYSLFQGAWKRTPEFPGRDFYAITGTSINDVYGVGLDNSTGGGFVAHFNGTDWSIVYQTPVPLYGVWESGDGKLVLVVGAQGMIFGVAPQIPDAGWTVLVDDGGLPANPHVDAGDAQSQEPILWGIAGTSVNDLAIPADLDRVFHEIGAGNFYWLDPVVDRTITFRSVFCVSDTNPPTYFFGTNYSGVIWLNNEQPADAAPIAGDIAGDASGLVGQAWQIFQDRSAGGDSLYIWGMWGMNGRYLFVGDQGRIYSFDTASQTFAQVPAPRETKESLGGVWGSSESDVWIVGRDEIILHGTLPGP